MPLCTCTMYVINNYAFNWLTRWIARRKRNAINLEKLVHSLIILSLKNKQKNKGISNKEGPFSEIVAW